MVQAVSIASAGQSYSRAATGLNADMTWCCWVKLAVDLNTYSMILSSDDGVGTNYNTLGCGSNGTVFGRLMTGGDSTAFPQFDLTVGTWAFVGCSHGSAVADAHVWMNAGGTLATSAASDSASAGLFDANTFYIGNTGVPGAVGINGSIAAVKVWTAALTFAELDAEKDFAAPVRTANLWANYTFQNGPQTTDESGNGRTLTGGTGASADASGPPITGSGGGSSPTLVLTPLVMVPNMPMGG